MLELYKLFASDWSTVLDFSDEAKLSLYNHESYGTSLSKNNGYAVGKKYLNLQVTAWREGIRLGHLSRSELYAEPDYPHWWLDSVLNGIYDHDTYETLLRDCRREFDWTRTK